MEALRPKGKFVYPTWITKLLAGENQCWYAAWYKAAHKYDKIPDDPEREAFFAEFNVKHDAIVERRAKELRDEGWTVKVETDFAVNGKGGRISGRTDIVAMKGDEALVVEAKSGRPRQSDHFQALLYMMMLPMDWLKGFSKISGEVAYKDGSVDVKPLTAADREKIGAALRLVTGPDAPVAVPSAGDCRYCDIAQCQYRYQATEGDAGGMF